MTCTANSANSENSKMRPIHIIENAPAMIAWAHEVNDTPRDKLQRVCDLQDVWGRSTASILKKIYCEDIAPHRSLVTFAIHKILSYDVFEDMIREWVHSKIAKERKAMQADIEKDYQRVADAQVRLGECRKAIYKRIKTEKLRADKLAATLRFRKREFDNLRTDYIKASNKADIYRADAKKYRDIVELLNPGQSSHQKGNLTLCV